MSETTSQNPLAALSAAFAQAVAAAAPSVVSIHSHRSLSSGFAWKPGLIVTADEALAEEGEVTVTLPGGERIPATVVGRDATTDVALVRVDAAARLSVVLLDGTPPVTGELALAVGSQAGTPIAAMGIVSASGPAWRSMRGGEIDARIELDLSLRRRADGALALNAHGRAFGMTVRGPRRRVLVIPAATIARVATVLETHGKMPRGYLGLALQRVRRARDGGVGVMVMSVDANGPGAKAGVHQGDVIESLNGQSIPSVGGLSRTLGPASVGSKLALGLVRGGAPLTVELVVGERGGRA